MTSKLCRYGCGTMLEGFDEEQRKFLEAGTGGLHTKERCQEAKSKLEQKNDHGNESFSTRPIALSTQPSISTEFLDHTAKGQSKVKIFTGSDQFCEEQYNKFLADNNGKIRTQGAQFETSREENHKVVFAIALYYEEVTKQ